MNTNKIFIKSVLKQLPYYDKKMLQSLVDKWTFLNHTGVSKNKITNQKLLEETIDNINDQFLKSNTYLDWGAIALRLETEWVLDTLESPTKEYFESIEQSGYSVNALLTSAVGIMAPKLLTKENKMLYGTFAMSIYKHFNNIVKHAESRKRKSIISTIHFEKDALYIGNYLTYKAVRLEIVEKIQVLNEFNKPDFFIAIADFYKTQTVPYIEPKTLPMLAKPREWEPDSLNGGVKGGYFLDKGKLLPDKSLDISIIERGQQMSIEYTPRAIKIINHIQETPFTVNCDNLNKILDNLSNYLEQEEDIHIHKYKNFEEFYQNNQNKPKWMKDHIYKEQIRLNYNNQQLKVLKVLTTLYIATALKDVILYFVIFSDFRGRLYRYGWPLNPQGDLLSKLLLKINDMGKSSCKTISLDASASGFSIYGMIAGNKTTLTTTNLLKGNTTDFYSYILTHLQNNISYFKKLTFNNKDIIGRNELKSVLIPFIYNQGAEGTETILKQLFYLNDKMSEVLPDNKRPLYSLASRIRAETNTLVKEIPTIKKYLTIIAAFNEKEECLLLQQNHMFTARMYYPDTKRTQIYTKYWGKDHFTTEIQTKKEPSTRNEKQTLISIAPNFIHSTDALILLEVAETLLEKGIQVSTVHDCFVVLESNKHEVQLAYKEAVKKIMKMDLLETLYLSPKNEVKNLVNYVHELESSGQDFSINPELDPKETKKMLQKILKQVQFIDKTLAEYKTNRENILNENQFNETPLKEEIYAFLPRSSAFAEGKPKDNDNAK